MHTYTGHGRRNYIPQSMMMVTKLRFNKYLWMLMTEGDPTVFKKKLGCFSNILGKERVRVHFLCTSKITMLIQYNLNIYKVSFIYLEKWALAYRHFEHRDTNILVKK